MKGYELHKEYVCWGSWFGGVPDYELWEYDSQTKGTTSVYGGVAVKFSQIKRYLNRKYLSPKFKIEYKRPKGASEWHINVYKKVKPYE